MQDLEQKTEQKISGKIKCKIYTTNQVNKKTDNSIYCVVTGQ